MNLSNLELLILLGMVLLLGSLVAMRGASCPLLLAFTNVGGEREAQFTRASGGHLPANPNRGVPYNEGQLKDIYLAGGCFWGVEAYLARIYGVAEVESGYANGRTENPTYEDVCYRGSGHAETVHVRYDPERIALTELLRIYFGIIDPTAKNRQGADVGSQYRSGIYYVDSADLTVIEAVVAEEQKNYDQLIETEVLPLSGFYPAEEHHQQYLEKNPGGYCHIDFSSLPRQGEDQ